MPALLASAYQENGSLPKLELLNESNEEKASLPQVELLNASDELEKTSLDEELKMSVELEPQSSLTPYGCP